MSERSDHKAMRTTLCRTACVLMLAATAAACDKCGGFVPPISFQADRQLEVCRDEAPRPR